MTTLVPRGSRLKFFSNVPLLCDKGECGEIRENYKVKYDEEYPWFIKVGSRWGLSNLVNISGECHNCRKESVQLMLAGILDSMFVQDPDVIWREHE